VDIVEFHSDLFISDKPDSLVEFRKYGGSSFSPLENTKKIAMDINKAVKNGVKQVIYCSAPGNFTESLKSMAYEINSQLRSSAVDGLVTCSDAIGSFLLQHSLQSYNLRVQVLNGLDNGILTDDVVSGANVLQVNANSITSKLEYFDVLIIPGGQGSNNQSITWLGKNSSDLSCLLQTIAMQQDYCSIYSDVDSVFNVDPNVYIEAIPFRLLDYDTVITAAKLGAKVLHYNAVVLAKNNSVEIVCKLNTPPFNEGTQIGNYSKGTIIVTDKKAQLITINTKNKNVIFEFLAHNNIFAVTKKDVKILKDDQILIPMSYVDYISELKHKFTDEIISGQSITALHVVSGEEVINSFFIAESEMEECVVELYKEHIEKGVGEYV
jgi:aspartate kinase